MTATTGGPSSLKEYLKRYESNDKEEEKKKKKKKKKKNPEASNGTGILVVDEDPVWQKPVNLDEEDDESADEVKPEVEEDIEVKRIKRLEQLRLRRPYNAIAEDGSGWVTIDSTLESNNPTSDMSPPRKPRTRNDTPSPESVPRPTGSSRENAYLSPPRKQRSRHDSPSIDPDVRPPPGLDPDLSLPRKRRARNDTPSPKHEVKPRKEDPDLSPPRQRRRRYDTPSPEPVKRSGLSTGLDSDLSPPRKHISMHDMLSPIGKYARKDTDLSPPRQRQRRYDTSSPERVKKPGQSVRLDSDLSPPRKHRARNDTVSPGPEVKPAREDTDLSPSRQQRRHVSQEVCKSTSDMDLSPPRKNKEVGSFRPSHRITTENGASGVSLVPDLSPPRRSQKEGSSIPASSKRQPRTGLISGKDISEEVHNIKNADLLRFQEMDPSITGRGAEPVYRDKKKGGRISKDEYLKSKQKIEEKPKEKKLEWVQGLAQKREAEARLQELELEKEKPFARTRDDPELDKMLKERVRWGDPMAHLVKKKHSEPALLDLAADEKMKESGFVIPQDIPSHSWLKRGLDAAPNRYGIRPGRHWDGVDRSNGYEKQMFTRMNEKRATEKEAYLWSVSDM